MAKAPVIIFNTDPGTVSTGNRYFAFAWGYAANNTTENLKKVPYRVAGTFSLLFARVVSNGRDGNSTIKVRVNNATVNGVITITASTTGTFVDATGSDTIVADDDPTLFYETAGSSGTISYSAIGGVFSATSNTAVAYNGRWQWAGTNAYNGIANVDDATGTESRAQIKYKNAGTVKGLYWNVEDNARAATTTVKIRVNGADVNNTLSIGSSATGIFQDASSTDTIASNDLVCAGVSGGGSGQTSGIGGGWLFENTSGKTEVGSTYLGGGSIGTGLTRYFAMGYHSFGVTTEDNTKTRLRFAGTASQLRVRADTNTISATSTFRLRVNGANGTQAVSITASTTGWFEDASGTDAFTATDELNFSVVTGGSGTNMMLTGQMITFEETAAVSFLPRIIII